VSNERRRKRRKKKEKNMEKPEPESLPTRVSKVGHGPTEDNHLILDDETIGRGL